MNQSMTGIWITRIALVIIVIGLGWFFLFSPWSSCSRNDNPQYELAKKDPALQLRITNYELRIDSLEKSNDFLDKKYDSLERSRHENIVRFKTENMLVEIRPMNILYPEMRNWLSPGRPLSIHPPSPLYKGEFGFDSLDVLSMAKKKIEYEYLLDDNNLLEEEKSNLNLQIQNYKWQVSDYVSIINLKDEQIRNLEAVPRTSTTLSTRKWYVDAGIIVGAFSLGYLVRSLIKK